MKKVKARKYQIYEYDKTKSYGWSDIDYWERYANRYDDAIKCIIPTSHRHIRKIWRLSNMRAIERLCLTVATQSLKLQWRGHLVFGSTGYQLKNWIDTYLELKGRLFCVFGASKHEWYFVQQVPPDVDTEQIYELDTRSLYRLLWCETE